MPRTHKLLSLYSVTAARARCWGWSETPRTGYVLAPRGLPAPRAELQVAKPAPRLGLSKAFESPEEVTERCKVQDAQRTVLGGSVWRVWPADAAAVTGTVCSRTSGLENLFPFLAFLGLQHAFVERNNE